MKSLSRQGVNGDSCARGNVVSEESQSVSSLRPDDVERLDAQRRLIEAHLGDDASREKYRTPAGKLGLLRALLQMNVFRPDQTHELQSMGVVLGDAFVQQLGLHWVMVEDEYGRDPALALEGTSILLYPLTMISKRVEAGEAMDVFDLFNWTADQVEQLE